MNQRLTIFEHEKFWSPFDVLMVILIFLGAMAAVIAPFFASDQASPGVTQTNLTLPQPIPQEAVDTGNVSGTHDP